MQSLRHLLLALVLCLAQIGVSAHAIEHALGEAEGKGGVPLHVCELCIAAHDLGAALPSLATLLPVVATVQSRSSDPLTSSFHLPAPKARQGAPPFA